MQQRAAYLLANQLDSSLPAVLYFSGREDEVSALREVVVRHILAVV
jgi:hypothetical protein